MKTQQQIIDELEIPPSLNLQMFKMTKAEIINSKEVTVIDPEEEEYQRELKREKEIQRQKHEEHERLKREEDAQKRDSNNKPNDKDVIAAILFINNLIVRMNNENETSVLPLPLNVNAIDYKDIRRIRSPLLKYLDPGSLSQENREISTNFLSNSVSIAVFLPASEVTSSLRGLPDLFSEAQISALLAFTIYRLD